MKVRNSKQKTEHFSNCVRLKQNLCTGVIVRWEKRKQQKIIPLKMLKSPKQNGEEAGRTTGVKSCAFLFNAIFFM